MQHAGGCIVLLYMPTRRKKLPERPQNKGSFADSHNGLLPLFADPDARGPRRWPEIFGQKLREQKARPFNALEVPRSSSDSK